MDALALLILVIGAVVLFDIAASLFGVDSRDGMTDDYRRPLPGSVR